MKLKPGYKQTEVGVIPEEWVCSTIDRIFQFKQGVQTPVEKQSPVERDRYIRFIRIIDLTNPEEPWRYIADPGITHHVTSSDLFMVRYGSPGLIGFGYAGVVANNLFRLLPKRMLDGRFYHHYLANRQMDVASLSGSSTMPAVTFSTLSLLSVVYPPLPEQRAIAEALGDVDALLGGLDRLIAKKRDIKQAAMQQLLTGQTRLPGFHGEWEGKTVAELEKVKLVKLSRGQVISKKDIDNTPGDFPIYSSSIHNEGLFGRYGDFMFDEEMITWSIDGGGNFFHRRKHRFSVTNVCGYMRVDTSRIDYRFFTAELQLLHSRKSFDYQSKAHPSVVRKEYAVQLPPLPEQTAIAEVLTDMDTELAGLEQRREKTRALKQAMMQELLTGRTRLTIIP